MHRRRESSPARLVLGIVAVMAITVLIQAIAAAVGWGLLALIFAVWMTRKVSRRR
jgi:hypothetical protein